MKRKWSIRLGSRKRKLYSCNCTEQNGNLVLLSFERCKGGTNRKEANVYKVYSWWLICVHAQELQRNLFKFKLSYYFLKCYVLPSSH